MMFLGSWSLIFDICFSWYLDNKIDGAITIVKYWCLFAVLMFEDKYGLGVGGIDRFQFYHLFYY